MKMLTLFRTALFIGVCLPFVTTPLRSQHTPPPAPDPLPAPTPRAQRYMNGMSFRSGGLLGVTLRTSSGPADTLGILIESVQDGMPAANAGIRSGARIMSIDDVDLRVEPRDLGDSAAERLPESRLRRALSAKAPGEGVTLAVWQDGRTETSRITLAETPGSRLLATTMSASPRRMLGVGFAQRGSIRDTAGLLVTSLAEGGAGETAGLMEGDRIVSVDEADLRVHAADAGSPEGVAASMSRLRRALDASRDSQSVRLEVLSEGRRRTLSVTPSREMRWQGFSISSARLQGMAADIRASVGRNIALRGDDRRELARAGDVILSIEVRALPDGNTLDVTLDRSRDQRIDILRHGNKETITLRSSR